MCEASGDECVIVTGDRDSLQLVSRSCTVCLVHSRMGKTEQTFYTPERFREEYGFEPAAMVDLKALMGDSSDNIPGVPGIGEKTAKSLLTQYGGIEEIYRDLAALNLPESRRKKLAEGEQSARDSYWLATIFREVPLTKSCLDSGESTDDIGAEALSPAVFRWNLCPTPALLRDLESLGFKKIIAKWKIRERLTDGGYAEPELSQRSDNDFSADSDINAKPSSIPVEVSVIQINIPLELMSSSVPVFPESLETLLASGRELALSLSEDGRSLSLCDLAPATLYQISLESKPVTNLFGSPVPESSVPVSGLHLLLSAAMD